MIAPASAICICLLLAVTNAMRSGSKIAKISRLQMAKDVIKGNIHHPFDELINSIFDVFPQVLAPYSTMDTSKIVKDPPAWTKARSGSGWRKSMKNDPQRLYHNDDIVDSFSKRYLGNTPQETKAKASKLNSILEELDEMQLLKPIDEYLYQHAEHPTSPQEDIAFAEKFVTDGITGAFSPLDASMNPLKVEADAKPFRKSLKLSELRKVLKNNPNYFK